MISPNRHEPMHLLLGFEKRTNSSDSKTIPATLDLESVTFPYVGFVTGLVFVSPTQPTVDAPVCEGILILNGT